MTPGRQIPPPEKLRRLQEEFGKSIRTPFSFATGRFQCRKERYSESLCEGIPPRKALSGRDRLAVYNEQYWYRLLTLLQGEFPLLARVQGYWQFNQLATEYLSNYPPGGPFLDDVPGRMPDFIRASGRFAQPRLIQIVDLEAAFLKSFRAPTLDPLNPAALPEADRERLPSTPIPFQPFFSLVEEDWNLMECRIALDTDGPAEAAFKEQKGYWAVYRRDGAVAWSPLDPIHFRLLQALHAGYPLEEACERSADGLQLHEKERLFTEISGWFAEWIRRQCFQDPFSKALIHRQAEII